MEKNTASPIRPGEKEARVKKKSRRFIYPCAGGWINKHPANSHADGGAHVQHSSVFCWCCSYPFAPLPPPQTGAVAGVGERERSKSMLLGSLAVGTRGGRKKGVL